MVPANSPELFTFSSKQNRFDFCFTLIMSGILSRGSYPSLMLGDFNLGESKVSTLLDAIIENLHTIKLINLQLNGNQLTDTIVEKVILLLQNPLCTLKFLNLSHNNITNVGIERIHNAIAASSPIKNLDLNVDEDEILKYKRAIARGKKLSLIPL